MAQTKVVKMMLGPHLAELRERWEALRRENMVQNGHMASPGTAWRGLGRVSGGPQRVHGVSWDGLERSCEGLWRSSEGAWGLLGRSCEVL